MVAGFAKYKCRLALRLRAGNAISKSSSFFLAYCSRLCMCVCLIFLFGLYHVQSLRHVEFIENVSADAVLSFVFIVCVCVLCNGYALAMPKEERI